MRRFLFLAVAAGACAAWPTAALGQFRVAPADMHWAPSGGAPIPLELLLGNGTIRKDLKLIEEQAEKIAALAEEETRKYRKEFESLALGWREPPPFETLLRKHIESQREQMRGILTARQLRRVEQIELQQMGRRALADREVREALNLTDGQAKTIDGLLDQADADEAKLMRELLGSWDTPDGTSADLRKRLEEAAGALVQFDQEVRKKLEGELTVDQKKNWQAMRGPSSPTPRPSPGYRSQTTSGAGPADWTPRTCA